MVEDEDTRRCVRLGEQGHAFCSTASTATSAAASRETANTDRILAALSDDAEDTHDEDGP